MTRLFITVLFSLIFWCSYAQRNLGGEPFSLKNGLSDENVPVEVMPELDMEVILSEDKINDQLQKPFRFAYPIPVDFSLNNSGYWEEFPTGDRVWRLKISSPEAMGLSLLYENFFLPEGALLYIYSDNGHKILGAYSSQNNQASKKFAHALIYDNNLTLEYYEPAEVKDQGSLTVFQVGHAYRFNEDCDNTVPSGCPLNQSGECQVNVNCFPEGGDWQDEKKGVARIAINGTWWCSGSLVNNTSEDCTPYFLTAHHCIDDFGLDALGDTDASTWCFYWNYEYPGCANTGDVPEEITVGATLRANDIPSDFALFELIESPVGTFDVYFNGWDATGAAGDGGVGIHHPRGDAKKIATHDLVPVDDNWFGTAPAGSHWEVMPWSATANGQSVTENGSSGSPLFNNDSRIIGQLHGGSSLNCDDPDNDPGIYGKISYSWDNNGAAQAGRRLRDWLDPVGLGTNTVLDGTYKSSPSCFAENNGPICAGEDLTLCETSVGAVGWEWTSLGGAVFTTSRFIQCPVVTNVSNGDVFEVIVTNANGCTSTCITIAFVYDNPIVAAISNSPICEGEDINLSAIVLGGAGDYDYMWTKGPAFVSNAPAPTIPNATLGDAGVYTVKVTDDNGCMATDGELVIVNENPTVIAGSNSPICEGENLDLTAEAFGGGGDYVYNWVGPNSFVSNLQSPTIVGATLDADGEYIVKVTDSNGCMGSDTIDVVVNPNPTVAPTSNSPVCENDHIYLYANPDDGTPPYTFEWDRLTGANKTKENPNVWDATFADEGKYWVTVTDINGCEGDGYTAVEIIPNIDHPGSITGDEYFCGSGYDPAPITSVVPATGPGPIEYFWMRKRASSPYFEVIPGATGLSYDPGVIYETTEYGRCARRVGCDKALETNMVTKTVGTEAVANISGPELLCVDEEGIFSVPNQAGAIYSWDFGWGAMPQTGNTASVTVKWTSFGAKTITVSVSKGGCTAYHFMEIFVSNSPVICSSPLVAPGAGNDIGTEQPLAFNKNAELRVYPNPFDNQLHIVLGTALERATPMVITDTQGRIVKRALLPELESHATLDLQDLPTGIYFLTLDLREEGIFYEKVIKN